MEERLQKVMSMAGVASRRESERLITEGQVQVNGKVVTELGTKVRTGIDRIVVNGKLLKTAPKLYFLLYKPRGVISSVSDEKDRKTVLELLPEVTERIYPVGRLDYNTEGALLLTNDGELTNALTHPKFNIDKMYEVKVQGIPTEDTLDRLRVGVKLEDGMTAPALVRLSQVDEEKNMAVFTITIHEGRNRQVRRMCDAIGYPVVSLKRTKFAMLTLAGLRRGHYRKLTDSEITALKALQ